jgi:hypothetical protein
VYPPITRTEIFGNVFVLTTEHQRQRHRTNRRPPVQNKSILFLAGEGVHAPDRQGENDPQWPSLKVLFSAKSFSDISYPAQNAAESWWLKAHGR